MQLLNKILALLDPRERWKLGILLVLATSSGLAQVVGVGSIMPFIGVLTNPELIQENAVLRKLDQAFGHPSPTVFLMLLGGAVIAAFVISNGLVAFTQWYTFRFARWNQFRLSQRLLRSYLHRSYLYHVQNNSAAAGNNILVETQAFTQQLLVPVLQAVAFSVSAVFITAFLVWLSPLAAAISIGIVGGAYGAVYVLLRRQLRRIGGIRLQASASRFKAVNEAFGAIKELKASGREQAFQDRFDPAAKRFAKAMATQQVLSQLPRYIIEVVGICGILLLVLLLLSTGATGATILPLVSVYAIAAYRLLPALQRIYLGASQLLTNMPVVEALTAALADLGEEPRAQSQPQCDVKPLSFETSIELRDVAFTYPGNEAATLEDVSLSIPKGAAVALIGSTGSGKTTLVDVIVGLLRPQAGEVRVDGVVLDEATLPRWRRGIGYVPQHIYLSDDTVAGNIALGVPHEDIDMLRVEAAARVANVHQFVAEELPARYDTIVGERGVRLSGGQRQRLGIARALYHDPQVLVLDEATSALDGDTEAAVQKALTNAARAKTMIVIAHRLSTLRDCDIVWEVKNGGVVRVDTREVLARAVNDEVAASLSATRSEGPSPRARPSTVTRVGGTT